MAFPGDKTIEGEPGLVAVLQEYNKAVAAGEAPDRDELTQRHPDLAAELKAYWADQDRRVAGGPSSHTATDAEYTSPLPLPTGRGLLLFGKYELLEEIARGGMGVVYKARQVGIGRIVALKMILAGQFASPADVHRFHTEAEAAANLDHPHIVPIYEVGEHQGQHYFTMKLIEGGSLAHWTADTHKAEAPRRRDAWRREQRQAAGLLAKVARAVHYAHQHGILHRDLKPANILLSRRRSGAAALPQPVLPPSATLVDLTARNPDSGSWNLDAMEPHITDFGLAKRVQGDRDLTQSGAPVGTPSYMAPEQARGQKGVSTATDVYGLGAILYQMLTGRPPFRADTPLETLLQVVEHEPTRPRLLRPGIDHDLETICLRCLEKQPGRRYGSAEMLAEELERWLRGEPILARPVGLAERAYRWCRRNPVKAKLTISLMALTLAVAIASLLLVANFRIVEARNEAVVAQRRAVASAAAAQQAQEEAEAQRSQADAQKQKAQAQEHQEKLERRKREGELALGRGIALCEQGDVGRGLLWFGRSLELAPPEAPGLQKAAWLSLLGWYPHAHGIRCCLAHPAKVFALAYSPDGKALATGGRDGRVRLWDAAAGTLRWQTPAHEDPVRCLAFNADGSLLLAGSGSELWGDQRGAARLYDAASGKPVGNFLAHKAPVWAVAFHPAGKTFVTGCAGTPPAVRDSGHDEGKVWLWDTATRKPMGDALAVELPKRQAVTAAVFSADGEKLLVGCSHAEQSPGPGKVWVWDLRKLKEPPQPLGHERGVRALALSPDGQTLLSGAGDGKARLWDWSAGRVRPHGILGHQGGRVTAVAFGPDGRLALTAGTDYKVRLWQAASGEPAGPAVHHPGEIEAVACSADGHTLATAQGSLVRLWELANLRLPQEHRLAVHDPLGGVALGPDGKTALVRQADGVRLCPTAPGLPAGPPVPLAGAAGALAVAADQEMIAVGSGPDVRLWNGTTGQPLLPSPLRHGGTVLAAAFSAADPGTRGSRAVLTGGEDGTAQLWGTAQGERLGPPLLHGSPVTAVAFHPDGATALTGTADGGTRLWDLKTGRAGRALAHAGAITGVAFSPDGRTFAVATWGDIAVRLFRTETAAALGPPLEHPAAIAGLAFSRDGQTLATACADGGARLWDVDTGQRLGPPLRCQSGVGAVAFEARGQTLLTIESGRWVRRWPLPAPPQGEPRRFVLWTQVLTGMRLDKQGAAHPLDGAAWAEVRGQLAVLGGPPEQGAPSAEQVRSWHHREADASLAARQWFAARWHLDHLLALEPQDPALYGRRGELAAAQGRWAAAAADFSRAIQLQPKWSTELWQEGVLAYLAAGDAAGYRRLCALLLDRAAAADDYAVAEKVAGLCRLGAGADLARAVQLAERVAARQPRAARHHHTLGALLYRAGRYREALDRLQAAANLRGSNDHAPDHLFLALTYGALHNGPEARRHFDKAAQLLARTAPEPTAETGGPLAWETRVELQLLRREAEALLATR
jgi:WD40 repeat protein/serine/threonine protein kinase